MEIFCKCVTIHRPSSNYAYTRSNAERYALYENFGVRKGRKLPPVKVRPFNMSLVNISKSVKMGGL